MTIGKKTKKIAVLKYFQANRLMTLSTSFKDKPWSATVFYAFDKNMNILFYSREDTKHCLNIAKNQNVSVVINHTWRYPEGELKGIQIAGKANKIIKSKYNHYYKIYKTRFKWADDFKSDHVLYMIKPNEIWYIDEKLFGHFHRVKI